MLYLLLSILTNGALVLILRAFPRFRVDLFTAIVFNYITAASFGFISSVGEASPAYAFGQEYASMSLFLGLFFISLFYIIGLSSQKAGVTPTSVANKMSLVIPVALAFILYRDPITIFRIAGILLGLAAVVLSTVPPRRGDDKAERSWFLPLLIFFGSGALDALINFSQKKFMLGEDTGPFVSLAFLSAASIGSAILLYRLLSGRLVLTFRSAVGGICLGLVNYFSIYFFILALAKAGMQSSILFPLNNMGIVIFTAVAGRILFGEKLSWLNIAGIGVAAIAIAMVMAG